MSLLEGCKKCHQNKNGWCYKYATNKNDVKIDNCSRANSKSEDITYSDNEITKEKIKNELLKIKTAYENINKLIEKLW